MTTPLPPQLPPHTRQAPAQVLGEPQAHNSLPSHPPHQQPVAMFPAPAGAPLVYTSPIPVRRAHLGHAILSEWTKIRSVRSTLWTLGLLVLIHVGITLLVATAFSDGTHAEVPVLSPGLFGMLLAQMCVITFGSLVGTSEYSTGMIRTTFTAAPMRGRVLMAKCVIFSLVAFSLTLVATGLASLLSASLLEGKPLWDDADSGGFPESAIEHGKVVATGSEWLAATVGASLFVTLLGLMALGVGILLRSSPGTITTMFGLVLLPFIASLFLFAEAVHDLGAALEKYSTINGLAAMFELPLSQDSPGGWQLLGLLTGVTLAVLFGAWARITVSDA